MCRKQRHHEDWTSRDPAEGRRSFVGHALTFALVVGGLALLNLATSPHYPWFIWPLLGWGIGLAKHGFAIVGAGGSLAGGRIVPPEPLPSPDAPDTRREWPDLDG